jgi:hypothetical protein
MLNALLARLDALGAKIGQAGTAIWQMYLRQQKIGGLELLVMAFVFLLSSIFVYCNKNKLASYCHYEDNRRYANVFFIILSIGLLVGTFACLINAADFLFNPGYWAFQDLIHTVQ